jgi:hypothetical protein
MRRNGAAVKAPWGRLQFVHVGRLEIAGIGAVFAPSVPVTGSFMLPGAQTATRIAARAHAGPARAGGAHGELEPIPPGPHPR